jgi:hypothetical protein
VNHEEARRWGPFALEVNAAVKRNMRARQLRELPDAWAALRWIRQELPYRYDPARPVADVRASWRRKDAACAEAAAIVAAVALRRHHEVSFCLETIAARSDYAHVTVTVDGVTFDPYADAALRAHACALRWGLTRDGLLLSL